MCKRPWSAFSLPLNQFLTVCLKIDTKFLGKLGNSKVFSAQNQVVSKKKKKRSSPKLRPIFWPKSEIQRFFPPKIRWSPKKKVFAEIEADFSAQIGHLNVWGGTVFQWGGLFSIFHKKSASKPPKWCDFAYFTSQWEGLELPAPPGYATGYFWAESIFMVAHCNSASNMGWDTSSVPHCLLLRAGALRAKRGPGISSNMTYFRFCERQNRQRKCRCFVWIMMWSPKKKTSLPKLYRVFRSKLGRWSPKKKKKKGLQASHADFSVSFWWASLELIGPLLGPLKPTAFLKPIGLLKSMGPGVIVPPSRWPCLRATTCKGTLNVAKIQYKLGYLSV